jgi:CheY-like chemotaxis protein
MLMPVMLGLLAICICFAAYIVFFPLARTLAGGFQILRMPKTVWKYGTPAQTQVLRQSANTSHKKDSILVVEDEAVLRESLKDWLIDSGYYAEVAGEGEEALELIEQRDFDLMLIDLRLPGKDGLEVLREARAKKPKVKGIIITAYPEPGPAMEAMKLGAVDFLAKPLDLQNLERLVAKTVGHGEVAVA